MRSSIHCFFMWTKILHCKTLEKLLSSLVPDLPDLKKIAVSLKAHISTALIAFILFWSNPTNSGQNIPILVFILDNLIYKISQYRICQIGHGRLENY